MPDDIPRQVGKTVRGLRLQRGWTQDDLAAVLSEAGGTWSRAKVGQLETEGVRGERLSDLALLCHVFDVGLNELLVGDEYVEVGTFHRTMKWVRDALESNSDTRQSENEHEIDPERIGAPIPSLDAELARKSGLSADELLSRWTDLFHDSHPAQVRDNLAGITPETPRRSAQAKRGQATRKLLQALTAPTHDDRIKIVDTYLLFKSVSEMAEETADGVD